MKSLADFLLLLIAVEHGAQMYINDSGPDDIFLTSYDWLDNRRANWFFAFVADAVNCKKCLTFWLALGLLVVRFFSRRLFLLLVTPLAVSSLATRGDDVVEWRDRAQRNLTRHQ